MKGFMIGTVIIILYRQLDAPRCQWITNKYYKNESTFYIELEKSNYPNALQKPTFKYITQIVLKHRVIL